MKIRSLATEARIIRHEECRARSPELRAELQAHRTLDVRREQRSTQLAYGFIRGRPYRRLEPRSRTDPDRKRVLSLIKKYGPRDVTDRERSLDAWFSEDAEPLGGSAA